MKRIFPAIILALLFHVVLLRSDVAWLSDKKIDTKTPPVMINMSYRRVEPVTKPKKPPEEIKIMEKKERIVQRPDPIKTPVDDNISEKIEAPLVDEFEEVRNQEEPEPDISEDVDTAVEIVQEAFPVYRANPAPEYPKIARKRGYEGTVVLTVLVNEDGQVGNLWVFESSGYKVLDNAAVEAVREWVFEPGRRGDRKIEMWVQIPVMFELE